MDREELNSLIDQALLDIRNTEAPTPEEAASMEYSDADYAKLLADITSEDEELAKAEIDIAANPDDDEENPDFSIDSIAGDKFYTKSSAKYKNGKISKNLSDKLMYSIDSESGNIELADSSKYDKELTPELSESERQMIVNRRIKDGITKRAKKKELEKIEINRMAFDQNVLPLSNEMTRWDKTALVEELTKNLRQLIRRYDDYINTRIGRLLSPAIPKPIKIAKLKWPWVFVANPGFLYKTHPESGEILTYWATPNIPYYFRQGTEQTILEERDSQLSAYFLENVDRAIHRWYETRRRLADREVQYATRILNLSTHTPTYADLLKYNPFWFKKLYERVKKDKPYGDPDSH